MRISLQILPFVHKIDAANMQRVKNYNWSVNFTQLLNHLGKIYFMYDK